MNATTVDPERMIELANIPLDKITFEDVQKFCARQIEEHGRLEYKRQLSSKDGPGAAAKIVSAMANTQGGIIIFGVEQEKAPSKKPELQQDGGKLSESSRDAIAQACLDHLTPPMVTDIGPFLANPSDSKRGFIVIKVQPSEQIHAMKGGSSIFLRLGDNSKPYPTSTDTMERLLKRRLDSIDTQSKHRSTIVEQLGRTIGVARKRGAFWVTIGPKILDQPFATLHELKDRVQNWSVKSQCDPFSIPVNSASYLQTAYQYIYGVQKDKGACAIDVYGNVALFANLARSMLPSDVEHGFPNDVSVPAEANDRILILEAESICERIITASRIANKVYSDIGYSGLLNVSVIFEDINCLPLVWQYGLSHWGANFCGWAPLVDSIQTSTIVSPDVFSNYDITVDALIPIVDSILWQWGDSKSDRKLMLDYGEQRHFGNTPCESCQYMCPNNRDKCYKCRNK